MQEQWHPQPNLLVCWVEFVRLKQGEQKKLEENDKGCDFLLNLIKTRTQYTHTTHVLYFTLQVYNNNGNKKHEKKKTKTTAILYYCSKL